MTDKTPVPINLASQYGTNLVYDAQELRLGQFSSAYFQKLRVNKKLHRNTLRISNIQMEYLQAYNNTQAPTILHVRDTFLGLALQWYLRNLQFFDARSTRLTSWAQIFWYINTDRKSLLDLENFSYWQTAPGTFGWYGSVVEKEEQPVDIITVLEKTLISYWQGEGVDSVLAARQRWSDWYLNSSFMKFNWQDMTSILDSLWEKPPADGTVHREVLKFARVYHITPNAWRDLKSKVWFGVVPLKLLEWIYIVVESRESLMGEGIDMSGCPTKDIFEASIRSLFGLPIGGKCLGCIAFAIESMLLAADYITRMPGSIQSLLYSEFLSSQHMAQQLKLAEFLALSYDAWSLLGDLGIIEEAQDNAYFCFQTAAQLCAYNELEVSGDSDYRLN